jgi:uncharacterized protein YegP (UPF0339 family)
MAGYFELKNAKGSKFSFNLRAGNHQVVLTSETYNTKAAAMNGIESVRKNAKLDGSFERKVATDGSQYFVQKATNGEVIGKSEMYASASGRNNGIASVKTNAPAAKIKDTTG